MNEKIAWLEENSEAESEDLKAYKEDGRQHQHTNIKLDLLILKAGHNDNEFFSNFFLMIIVLVHESQNLTK